MTKPYGVYAIVVENARAVYIGATRRAFTQRWREHQLLLQRGLHTNNSLQRLYDENGPAALDFKVLADSGDEKQVYRQEDWWMRKVRQVFPGYWLVNKRLNG